MKCPFTPGECIGRECPGWSLGSCFLEIFIQKMDTISLKLDTLCNLTSLTAVSNAGKPNQPEPVRSREADPIKEPIEKETRPASNQSTFWKFPGIALKPERRAANQHRDPFVRSRVSDAPRGPEKPLESQVQERAKQPAAETQKEVLSVDTHHTVLEETHDNGVDREAIQEEKPFLEFPAKVSDIVFGDETEARVTDALRVAQSIEPQELTLELTPVEEFASEVHEGLAVSERVLLMAQPANGSGTIDVMVDDLPHDLDTEWPIEQDEATPQEAETSALNVMSTAAEEPAASTEEAPERVAASAHSDLLSVEKVIDDITSTEEPPTIADAPAATVIEPDVALSDLSSECRAGSRGRCCCGTCDTCPGGRDAPGADPGRNGHGLRARAGSHRRGNDANGGCRS